jgi:hypothetical protein
MFCSANGCRASTHRQPSPSPIPVTPSSVWTSARYHAFQGFPTTKDSTSTIRTCYLEIRLRSVACIASERTMIAP